MCNINEKAIHQQNQGNYRPPKEEIQYIPGADEIRTNGEELKAKEYQASLDSEKDLLGHTTSTGSSQIQRRLSEIDTEKQNEFARLASTMPTNDSEVDRWIRQWIRAEVKSLHATYPWLQKNRSNIAWMVTIIPILIFIATVYAHYHGHLSNLSALIIGTLTTATLHEVEHDVFHCQYLWRPKSLQFEIAMWLIYVFKFHVSPWWRMEYHLLHHQESGQKFDIEERLLGLGLPIGLFRLFVTLTPLSFFLVVGSVVNDNPGFVWYRPLTESKLQLGLVGLSLFAPIFFTLNHFLPTASITEQYNDLMPDWFVKFSWTIFICCLCVAHLRHFCLTLVTTFTHYYGDIHRGVVHEQIQILDSPFLIPLQIFCWFFGESHWIHHFYVQQPFWERALISWEVNKAAKSELWKRVVPDSVRVNDFPTLDMIKAPNARYFKNNGKKNK